MRRQGVKVKRQAITRKDGQTTGCQPLCDFVHKLVRHGLCAWTECERGDELGTCITGDPQPGGFDLSPDFEPQFIELDVGQMECPHQAIM